MTDHPWSDWYSVPELAPRIHMSVATIKRRLAQWSRDGQPIVLTDGSTLPIQAEKIARPQGDEWRVRVRGDLPSVSAAPERPDSKAPPLVSAAQGDDPALMALREILTEERAERRKLTAENAALNERVAALSERAGRADLLAEQLAASRQRESELAERLGAAEERLAARRWWWPWGS